MQEIECSCSLNHTDAVIETDEDRTSIDIANDRLKQQFFRLMSQEYRTSLSTILMSVDELEFDALELDREETELCRQQIRLAVEHMRHLLYEARENF